MATVSERIKDTFTTAKSQIEGFEKNVEKKFGQLEKKAKKSIGEAKKQIDDVPEQLKGAWGTVIDRVRGALDYASREELRELTAKVDALAKKLDKLMRGEKIKEVAAKEKQAGKRA